MLRFRWVLLFLTPGCVTYTFTPPLRAVALESPAVLSRGETAVVADGAWHVTTREVGIETGSIRARRGLPHGFEGTLESSFTHYDAIHVAEAALRIGLKKCIAKQAARWTTFDDCWLALIGGAGGGIFDGGGVVGGDVGLILGYENPYVVPFLGARFTATVPTGPRSVYDGDSCAAVSVVNPGQPCGPAYNEPRPTFGLGALAGFRVPIVPGAPVRRLPRSSVLVGVQLTDFFDLDKSEVALAFTGGVEVVF